MSDYTGLAMVTAALQQIIQTAAHSVVSGASVKVGPPEDNPAPKTSQVDLYLYRVATNAELRNNDLPRWGAGGTVFQKAQAAINLHYLVSFAGPGIEPELMMGKVVSHFHGIPQISRKKLEKLALHATPGLVGSEKLKGCDLSQSHDTLTITPSYLDFDETSKLWSSFFQVRHRRSLMYIVHPLMVDCADPKAYPEVNPKIGLLAQGDAA